VIAAVIAVGTAVTHWSGWFGWAVGLFAGAGLLLFDFQRWWAYLSRGEREDPPARPRLSGSARFQETGTTCVQLISVGDRPRLVAMRLRAVTGLSDAQVAELMARAPARLPAAVSFRSAGHIVQALRAAGASAHLVVHGTGTTLS
jgi:hypothetical protein